MKTIKAFLYTACLIMFMFGAWNLYNSNRSTERTTELYSALADSKPSPTPTAEPDDVGAGYHPIANEWLVDLQEQNGDLAAWLTVDGTNIDYPVMQTVLDNDFYLNHDFSRRYDSHGTPFFDVNCRLSGSDNLIIYAHHMNDKTMFQNLMLFRDAAFCEKYGQMHLDTVEYSRDYELLFVMVISAAETADFPYYQKINLSRDNDYTDFLDACAKYSVWQRDTMPEPGTPLLTLSTCEYTKQNGRLVVVSSEVT